MRRVFAPEVVQTSAMDCGPASLKCLLEGHGVRVSYGRLREACQTDVDGTSIDTMEDVAVQLGLDAEQIVIPPDHVLLEEAAALPAIVVVRQPNGATHFVVAWSTHGPVVQVMDPGTGRQWTTRRAFLAELYLHQMVVPAEAWEDYARGPDFTAPLRRRLRDLGAASDLVEGALARPGWGALATLDAATRMVDTLVRTGGLQRGAEARGVLAELAGTEVEDEAIPEVYWSVRPAAPDEEGAPQLSFRGAVLVRARGRRAEVPDEGRATLSPELVAALSEPPERPGRRLLGMLAEDGVLAPLGVAGALGLSAGAVVVEAVLLRGVIELGQHLALGLQRLGALAAFGLFLLAMLVLDLGIARALLRLGRGLEVRLRLAFLEKLPRLGDRYFQSRLTSDMAERSHAVQRVRALPPLGGQLLRATFGLAFTVLGIAVLDPWVAPLALLSAVTGFAFPLLAQPVLSERDLRVRNHAGALSRFYLDALLGMVPIRSHGAAPAVRREHEALLVEWARAGLRLQQAAVWVEGGQAVLGMGIAALVLVTHLAVGGETGGALLLVYWALNLPVLAAQVALVARQYPALRNATLRLVEPLGAMEAPAPAEAAPPLLAPPWLSFRDVTVVAAGHPILSSLDFEVPAGSHVAIVGRSGAGKSSLVGLLLGWYRPAAGRILLDGKVLDEPAVERLRRQTAWVDPAVQIWNRPLLDNLRYGLPRPALGAVLDQADLVGVLERLPEGLQSRLGEGGGLVSGGEGQRVRLARAMLRDDVKLVILDEPFRGLDRPRRRVLMERARQVWADATLLCITHDVGETLTFPRVLVVEGGRVVEDGPPEVLTAREGSLYQALVRAEEQVRTTLWQGDRWRRLWMERGSLGEEAP